MSHQEDVLKLFTTKLISLRLLHPPSSVHSDCKYLFEGIKFEAVLFLSHHSAFTTQFIYVNSVLPPKREANLIRRLIFNSFIEINHANSLSLSAHGLGAK